jgi:hypothetical protein
LVLQGCILVRAYFFLVVSSAEGPLFDFFFVYFRKNSDPGISSWDWNLSGQHSTYHALFPRAWTVYDGMPLQAYVVSFLKFSVHQELYLLFLQLSTKRF